MKRLALGTAQFGLDYGIANRQGQIGVDEGRAILDFAAASGMDTLDTAIAYGESERRLGEIGVHRWQIVSKLPAAPEDGQDVAQWVSDSVRGSLSRLKIETLHGLLLHRPHQLLHRIGDALYGALEQQKREGLAEKIGVSVYQPADLSALMQYRLDIVQAPLNVWDRRLVDSGWLFRLSDQGTDVHVRSIFLQGLLLMRKGDRAQRFSRWASLWKRWDEWLRETGLSPLQVCVRYALSFPEVGRVVVGVDSVQQLHQVVEAAGGPAPKIPGDLQSDDIDLINPVRWRAM